MIGQAIVLNGNRVNTNEYKYRVDLPDGYKDGADQWLKDYVKRGWSIIYYVENIKNHAVVKYYVGFMKEDMAMAFKLMWS